MSSLAKIIISVVAVKAGVFLTLVVIGAVVEHQEKKNDERKWEEYLKTAKI